MICSLTRSAAAEVAERATAIPRTNVGTLHSMALRAIGPSPVLDSDKGVKIWNEWIRERRLPEYALSTTIGGGDEAITEGVMSGETAGDQCLASISVTRARMLPVDGCAEPVTRFWDAWQECKRETGYIDYADMIEIAFRDADCAPNSPDCILADEAQDIPLAGVRLLRKWAGRCGHFATVGDPLQNLYHWAGTDWSAFLTPDISPDRKRILDQSYRVPAAVHRVAVAWVQELRERVEQEFGKKIVYHPRREILAERPDGTCELGDVVEGDTHRSMATYQSPGEILLDAEPYLEAGKTVAIIGACGYMVKPMVKLLRQEGVPFHNPWRVAQGAWNPLARRNGTSSSDRILAWARPDYEVWGEECRVWTAPDLALWLDCLETKGLLRHGAKSKAHELALGFGVGSRELPVDEICNLFVNPDDGIAAIEAASTGDLDWFGARVLPSKAEALEFPLTVARRRGAKTLDQKPQVIVGTIHSLKGAEADRVYLLPDLSARGWEQWDHPGEGHDGIVRAFYVGITRARESLVVCSPASNSAVEIAI